jgi:hypothetical protein
MSKLDNLYEVLLEQLDLYMEFLLVEQEKYNIILADDVKRLDEIVTEEQVFFLKSRGLDQKRERLLNELGFAGKTLKQLIELVDISDKTRFEKIYHDIFKVLQDFKDKNKQCQDLVQIRLYRAQAMINKLDESTTNRNLYFKDGNKDEIDVNKMKFISKKI